MDHTAETIRQLVLNAASWEQTEEGTFLVDTTANTPVDINRDELSTLHPALPTLLDALIEWNKQNRLRYYISGAFVYETVRLLRSGGVSFTDITGTRYTLCDISKIDFETQDPYTVGIEGTSVKLVQVDFQGTAYPVVVNDDWCATIVSKSVLEKSYPGWESKWVLGTTLDLAELELQQFAFESESLAPQEGISLTNVTFPG